jgi:hypothetical protein
MGARVPIVVDDLFRASEVDPEDEDCDIGEEYDTVG